MNKRMDTRGADTTPARAPAARRPAAKVPPPKKGRVEPDCYATMPKTVRVGAYDYTIEVLTSREAGALGVYGHCAHYDLAIRIADDLHVQHVVNTLVHEIFHAICWVYGSTVVEGNEGESEESFVNQGANGFMQVWRDNPELMLWVHRWVNHA